MKQLDDALWIAHTLFSLGKTSGSSANMSFKLGNEIYITKSGGCFGRLTEEDFSVLSMEGQLLSGPRPSKEAPLHLMLYKNAPTREAVIHTHGPAASLWSCLDNLDPDNCIPHHTPYLGMRLGNIRLIPYEKPGSPELFAAFERNISSQNGYLLSHHGAITAGTSLMDAFYNIEEIEASARIAWELYSISGALPD